MCFVRCVPLWCFGAGYIYFMFGLWGINWRFHSRILFRLKQSMLHNLDRCGKQSDRILLYMTDQFSRLVMHFMPGRCFAMINYLYRVSWPLVSSWKWVGYTEGHKESLQELAKKNGRSQAMQGLSNWTHLNELRIVDLTLPPTLILSALYIIIGLGWF